ncbi:lytic polysaccharide monooxygenase auxiliary activity family 9 protein [Marilutibacter spongiae]|uniref:Lytic polysaccharide monooxygenase n=1 Tax=Marilutibacter spongiae TaxID=2025720 RepID=A0A7W3Y6R6_9GAMM|nr:lytic polysaccharide monooxygenase [Lysobacter spongiae]MBB1061320.1 lytic polysaccharide monooxygenase [Lysobacter spongiae]
MKTHPHLQWGAIATCLLLGALPLGRAEAHGTMVKPVSRIYACAQGNRENPADPACRAAWEVAGPQLFYDWMGINQANANGNHQAVVPDGKLCSGNNPTFRGLDLVRSDWQATDIAPEANGRYEFLFKGTAPHSTREWVFYVTPEGWNPNTALKWSDLQEFCRIGNTPLSADGNYHLSCQLPQRSGRHVIYNTWQRSDSTEAFYTCMDVKFAGGTNPPPPPQWQDAGALVAQNALPVGTQVSLRVFNADGSDAERIDVDIATTAQGSTTAWPKHVGEQVNARASFARIGVLANGSITPVASASGNHVYLSGTRRRHQIDITLPQDPPPPGEYDYVYPDGIGQYKPGETVVKGSDGKLYACRPFPEGGWCNINSTAHYAPGTGSNWRDAWVEF